jgi:hypothetical protein
MVYVDDRATLSVLQRRQFMGSTAVKILIEIVALEMFPALLEQFPFNRGHCRFWHENIYISGHSPLRERQIQHRISAAF